MTRKSCRFKRCNSLKVQSNCSDDSQTINTFLYHTYIIYPYRSIYIPKIYIITVIFQQDSISRLKVFMQMPISPKLCLFLFFHPVSSSSWIFSSSFTMASSAPKAWPCSISAISSALCALSSCRSSVRSPGVTKGAEGRRLGGDEPPGGAPGPEGGSLHLEQLKCKEEEPEQRRVLEDPDRR